uniref:Uncharacterized protein n=1 Tax=Anguilla anguilla TaxID=7936 RepID=A0A0E9V0Y2_ANGAN
MREKEKPLTCASVV